MALQTSPVPANRLGQLLSEARLRTGNDLEELASKSDFTVGELSDLEAGHRLLNDELISQVTELYELDCGRIVPQRSELTIDMTDRTLSAAGRRSASSPRLTTMCSSATCLSSTSFATINLAPLSHCVTKT